MSAATVGADQPPHASARPAFWFVASTGVLALTLLVLALAETDLKAQYFIDEGEFISVLGLVFVSVAGAVLALRRQLAASLPLVFPWLLYPVVSQGDQIIDHLSINPMRAVVHVLLAAIFATPVAVVVLAVRAALTPRTGPLRARRAWMAVIPGAALIAEGRTREGAAILTASLLAVEMVAAALYLGRLMIVTLVVMMLASLAYGSWPPRQAASARRRLTEQRAVAILAIGVVVSYGAYWYYKNLPGAYQGSPSFFMDPAMKNANYAFDHVAVPQGVPGVPADPEAVRAALNADARALTRLLDGYHILERNYTYDFHNHLFVRNNPVMPGYRAEGLKRVAEAQALRTEADAARRLARATLGEGDPMAALLDELGFYVAFQFDRAPVLERMSAGFERTQAGLQHAAHLYEGEAKYLGDALAQIVTKHRQAIEAPHLAAVTAGFAAQSRAMYEAYADHVVGF